MMIGNIQRFSIAEMTSNDNGKTSGSGTMGILVTMAGIIGFLYGTFFAHAILMTAIEMTALGATLLGVRKWKNQTTNEPDSN